VTAKAKKQPVGAFASDYEDLGCAHEHNHTRTEREKERERETIYIDIDICSYEDLFR